MSLPGQFYELNVHFGVLVGGMGDFSEIFLGNQETFRNHISMSHLPFGLRHGEGGRGAVKKETKLRRKLQILVLVLQQKGCQLQVLHFCDLVHRWPKPSVAAHPQGRDRGANCRGCMEDVMFNGIDVLDQARRVSEPAMARTDERKKDTDRKTESQRPNKSL